MNISRSIPFGALLLTALVSWETGYSNACSVERDKLSIDEMTDHIRDGIGTSVKIVEPVYNDKVRSYLRTYIERNPARTEEMMGRAVMYFPIFEEYLEKYDMPTDLKYLAIIESALVPYARSHVGAVGIWQFMQPTAREFGLRMTTYIDERRDPVKATDAAVRYLKSLHERFGSWELAMAAYNAGPGRVNYAIRRSGSHDYWKLSRYLPRETRAYVPGFIAANYLFHHHADHGLIPQQPHEHLLNTRQILIYEGMSFMDINQITGVPIQTISQLNPVYSRRYIPRSVFGYVLTLPVFAVEVMEHYLSPVDVAEDGEGQFKPIVTGQSISFVEKVVPYTYIVSSGDNLYNIGQAHGCSVRELLTWNKLSSTTLRIGQRLMINIVERVAVIEPDLEDRTIAPVLPLKPITPESLSSPAIPVFQPVSNIRVKTSYAPQDALILRRRTSVSQAARKYHGLNVSDISLPSNALTPGSVIRVAPNEKSGLE
jgi:LysM repeat protein